MGQTKPTYAETVAQVEQYVTDAHRVIKAALFHAELTTQERDALTNIVMELLDAGHKIIDAKYINNR